MAILENPQHERFCVEYIRNGKNATQAGITAGYSENTSAQQASRLLTNVKIQERLKELRLEIRAEDIVDISEELEALSRLRLAAEAADQINNALKATELRIKTIGGFTDKIEQKTSGDFKIVLNEDEADIK